MSVNRVEKIKKISRAIPSFRRVVDGQATQATSVNKPEVVQAPEKVQNAQQTERVTASERVQGTSPIEELRETNRRTNRIRSPSYKNILEQTNQSIAQVDTAREQLQTPGLSLKSSVQDVLNTKLNNIEDNLKVALEKAGVDYAGPARASRANPVTRFLDLLTGGQTKLEQLATHVGALHEARKQMSPAGMLAIQLKVTYIQQELEFFTNVLNKSLESTKTIMNIQV